MKNAAQSIRGIVSILKVELQIDNEVTVDEVVEISCKKLGIVNGTGLLETALRCYHTLFPDLAVASDNIQNKKLNTFSENALIFSKWEAGSEGFTDGTPWVFTADNRFSIQSTGADGVWKLIQCAEAPGGWLLRVDWSKPTEGEFAEFHLMQPPPVGVKGSITFHCIASSIPYMFNEVTTFTIRCIVHAVEPALPILSDPNFPLALRKMQECVKKIGSRDGPNKEQLETYKWFDGRSQWISMYPLHRAALHGDLATLNHLIQSGRDPNERMGAWYDCGPLSWAATFNHVSCINSLIAAGADPRIRNRAGQTPVEEAHYAKHDAAGIMMETFLFFLAGQQHAGQQGIRSKEYEDNYARIWCPVAGFGHGVGPGANIMGLDEGAYTHPCGCCFYTSERKKATHGGEWMPLCCPLNLFCWSVSLCYQPCGLLADRPVTTHVASHGSCTCHCYRHQNNCVWMGDCPMSEQRVTYDFVRKHPELVVRGPAKMRRDCNIATKYR